ncbi:cytochrome P450 71A1-like [Euphorbia lathyris]|uniref:cytochrome P450 71A1-like n=1 Tax=Euphorbia lathyris TaxID=212925 RepID=UPI0033131E73
MDGISLLHLQQWWWILFSVFLFLSFLHFLTKNHEKRNSPPSPPKLPIIGNLHQLGGLAVRSLQSLSQKYGPLIILHFGHVPTLLVSSAEIAQEILKTNDVIFSNRPQSRASDAIFYGSNDIVFSPYGEYWRQVKKISVLHLLSQKRVHESHSVRNEEVEKIVEKIRSVNGGEINLSETFLSISNNVISKSAIGGVFDDEVRDGRSFGGLLRSSMDLMGEFSFKDFYPSFGWLDYVTGLVRKLKGSSEALYEFLDEVIEEHQGLNGEKSKDIVDILLHLQKEGLLDIDLTRQNIKAILMDMFVGGTDTTATAMEWIMAELLKNPTIMKKAQEEVRRVLGNKSKLTETDMNHMVYLKCIVKESLRLHPPAFIFRESSQNVKVKGYDIPAKTRVLINVWSIQRDPQVWDRPHEFIPERFGDTSKDFKGGHVEFIPFGFGRRICPGLAFAVSEVECVLANLLYWFDWELPNGERGEDLEMDEVHQLIIRKKTPLVLVPVCHFPQLPIPNN